MSYDLSAFGQYRLDRLLAQGGMAEIFVAHREGQVPQEELVLKRIRPDRANDPAHVELFLNEARIAAHFDHPNLVPVHELLSDHGELAMVMDYVAGHSVQELLQRCRQYARFVPFEIAAYIIAEAAEGLHYAHELRDEAGEHLHVVHRDVSPANIVVTPNGGVRLLDFGVAASDLPFHEGAGVVRGKFSYMAPEAVLNQPLDRRADVFGLGVVFYELLSLQPCFTHADPVDTLDAIITGRYRPVRESRDSLPHELEEILERMLASSTDDRYATAAEVSIELWQYLVQTDPIMANDVQSFFAELFLDARRPETAHSPHDVDTVEIDTTWLLDYANTIEGTLAAPIADEDTLIDLTDDIIAALELRSKRSAPRSAEPVDDGWSVTSAPKMRAPRAQPIDDDETWWVHESSSLPPRISVAD